MADYRIEGKPLKDMTDDELRAAIDRLRGQRAAFVDDSPKSSKTKKAPVPAKDISSFDEI